MTFFSKHTHTHTYCHLGWVRTGSCCAASSPLPLGGKSYQWAHELLPPKIQPTTHRHHCQTCTHARLRTHARTHTILEVAGIPTFLKKLSMKPSLSTATATTASSSACVCTDEQNVWMTYCADRLSFIRSRARKDTYSTQFSQSILHDTDRLVSCPDKSSKPSAGSPCKSPCVE